MMQLDKAAGEIEVLRDYETKQVAKLKTMIPDWWK